MSAEINSYCGHGERMASVEAGRRSPLASFPAPHPDPRAASSASSLALSATSFWVNSAATFGVYGRVELMRAARSLASSRAATMACISSDAPCE